jgi:hypothetical protein
VGGCSEGRREVSDDRIVFHAFVQSAVSDALIAGYAEWSDDFRSQYKDRLVRESSNGSEFAAAVLE